MLVLKNKKETDRVLAHVEVWIDGEYFGYIIKNNSMASLVNENWNFVSCKPGIKSCHAKTKSILIDMVKNNAYNLGN